MTEVREGLSEGQTIVVDTARAVQGGTGMAARCPAASRWWWRVVAAASVAVACNPVVDGAQRWGASNSPEARVTDGPAPAPSGPAICLGRSKTYHRGRKKWPPRAG